jgi:hypothetical protein
LFSCYSVVLNLSRSGLALAHYRPHYLRKCFGPFDNGVKCLDKTSWSTACLRPATGTATAFHTAYLSRSYRIHGRVLSETSTSYNVGTGNARLRCLINFFPRINLTVNCQGPTELHALLWLAPHRVRQMTTRQHWGIPKGVSQAHHLILIVVNFFGSFFYGSVSKENAWAAYRSSFCTLVYTSPEQGHRYRSVGISSILQSIEDHELKPFSFVSFKLRSTFAFLIVIGSAK